MALELTFFAARRISNSIRNVHCSRCRQAIDRQYPLWRIFFYMLATPKRLPQHGAAGHRGGMQLSAHKLQVIFDVFHFNPRGAICPVPDVRGTDIVASASHITKHTWPNSPPASAAVIGRNNAQRYYNFMDMPIKLYKNTRKLAHGIRERSMD